jgi:formylglycine-generating enzyme required for sulfatase activity
MSLMKRLRAYAGKNAFSTEKPADDPGMEQGMVWSPTRWKGRGFTADEDAFDDDARKTKPARPRSTRRGWFPDGLTRFSNFSRVILIIMLLAAAVLAMNIVIAVLNRNAIAESTLPGALSLAPLPTPTPGVGSTRVSPVDGMRLVYVPAGEFVMGGDAYFEERPVHTVILDAFWIDQTEVTNGMFASFLNAWGNRQEDGAAYLDDGDIDSQIHFAEGFWRADPVYQDHPVVEVTWYGANAYCSWAGRRLPTEAEWEKAARGKAGGIYPWGNDELTTERLNFNDHVGDTAEAGSYPDGASPYGALDMAGNVWEWVADLHSRTYYSISPLENPPGPETGFFRVLRGGGWNSRDTFVRSMHRNRGAPTISHAFVGFRCADSE